jgi:hypothetical protein
MQVATILVGPSRIKFRVPVHVLTDQSPFFAKAFQGPFKEAETKVMELPDDEPETFARFKAWVRLARTKPDCVAIADTEVKNHMKILDLAKLWVFAEKVRVPILQNTVMSYIVDRYKDYNGRNIALDTFNYVFDNTTEHSQLRRVFVDFVVHNMDREWYDEHKGGLHVEFIEDLCLSHDQDHC